MIGTIFDIQQFCVHDGPGIRTTVFLKGCPMRCAWCHNPEGMRPGPELSFSPENCIGCGACFRVCPRNAHENRNDAHVLDRTKCVVCGACAEECCAGALEIIGRKASVDDVIADVAADRPFYDNSGGGMTLSGGEPLFQLDFASALLARAKDEGIHCCIETCGHVPYESFSRVMPDVDLFLYDIKDMDPERHLASTGVSNESILSNLRRLHDDGARIRIRIPLVAGYNDRKENLDALVALAVSLPRIEGVEILPYHALGRAKAVRIGAENAAGPKPSAPDCALIRRWEDAFRTAGVPVMTEA